MIRSLTQHKIESGKERGDERELEIGMPNGQKARERIVSEVVKK